MDKNFLIDSAITIEVGGRLYDLHNFYDFKELNVVVDVNSVCLLFAVSNEFNRHNGNCGRNILIKFKDVDYLEFSQDFAARLTCDLEEIGYKSPDDRDVNWVMSENQSTNVDHLLFRFANDEYVRIHSKEAHCTVS